MTEQIDVQDTKKTAPKKIDPKKMSLAEKKAYVQKMEDAQYERDSEMISCIFRYLERPGDTLKFKYSQYARDGFPEYEFKDGERYRMRRDVIKHLNNNVHYLQYNHVTDRAGSAAGMSAGIPDGRMDTRDKMTATKKIPRCEVIPMEFLGEDDADIMPSKIIEVRNMVNRTY